MELQPSTGSLSVPKMLHERILSGDGMILAGETEEPGGGEPVSVPLRPPRISPRGGDMLVTDPLNYGTTCIGWVPVALTLR